jgi:hypothetical protein
VDRELVYQDYLTLRGMNADHKTKVRMIQDLVSQSTNNWRVIGVTLAALNMYHQNDFKYLGGKVIQRAHLKRRFDFYSDLIKETVSQAKFWNTISEGDRTILAMAGERTSPDKAPYVALNDQGLFPERQETIYFRSRTVGYSFGAAETNLLKHLYEKNGLIE